MSIDGDRNSYFCPTIFTRQGTVRPSRFIRAMHPKTQIRPELEAIQNILGAGWVGQRKVHGHRAQIHIPCDPSRSIVAFTRQGTRHKMELSPSMVKELFRLFTPEKGWNVIDAEWLKPEEKLFVFDFLKREDEVLRLQTYPDRFKLLPRNFLSPHVVVLPLIKDLESCLKELAQVDPRTEGLVFKSTTSIGFSDSSIVRCRRRTG